jgi:hypothetical protein
MTMAYGNGGYAQTATTQGPADAPRPISPVVAALHARNSDLSELHQAIGELEARLSDVLRPIPPGALTGKGEASSVRSVVTTQLVEIGNGITEARARLVAILERLDV